MPYAATVTRVDAQESHLALRQSPDLPLIFVTTENSANFPHGTYSMHLNELKALHVSEVLKQAEELEIENTGRMRKQELMFAIIKKRARTGEQIIADGVLEILPDGFGFLRSPDTSYTASTCLLYTSDAADE